MVQQYVGSRISLISKNENRYEGILHSIDMQNSTVALSDVMHLGTEGRCTPDIPPTVTPFSMIVFRGSDIKDLAVCDPETVSSGITDPAIVSATVNSGEGKSEAISSDAILESGKNKAINKNLEHESETAKLENEKIEGSGFVGRRSNYGKNRGKNRYIVGELNAKPNDQLRAEVENEFDFVEHNMKFDKSDLKQLIGNKGEEDVIKVGGYSKNSGFFDSISCETLNPTKRNGNDGQRKNFNKVEREKQFQLDAETFGRSAVRGQFRRNYRGYRRRGQSHNKST